MPASCVTRWWTSLPALQFIRDQQEAIFDVLYKLKTNSLKYLPNCNEQKLIRVICNLYEPLKTLGEHMSSEQVVTASSIWPIYLKLKESILQNNDHPRYTCELTQVENQDNNCDTDELFPITSQCALSTGEITSYLNNNEVDESNNSDEDTSANASNDTSSDTMLNHLEDHIKRAIKTPLLKRYDSNQARPILQ